MIQIEIVSKKEEKKEKLLREVTVKIGSKQEDDKDGITVKVLLDIGMTWLVMSSELIRKNKFKKNKLEKLIYVKNVNGIFQS